MQKVNELRISLFLNLWIFSVDSVELVTKLSNQLMSLLILNRLLDNFVFCLNQMNNSLIDSYIDISVVIFKDAIQLFIILHLDSFQFKIFHMAVQHLSCSLQSLLEISSLFAQKNCLRV